MDHGFGFSKSYWIGSALMLGFAGIAALMTETWWGVLFLPLAALAAYLVYRHDGSSR